MWGAHPDHRRQLATAGPWRPCWPPSCLCCPDWPRLPQLQPQPPLAWCEQAPSRRALPLPPQQWRGRPQPAWRACLRDWGCPARLLPRCDAGGAWRVSALRARRRHCGGARDRHGGGGCARARASAVRHQRHASGWCWHAWSGLGDGRAVGTRGLLLSRGPKPLRWCAVGCVQAGSGAPTLPADQQRLPRAGPGSRGAGCC